MVNIRRYDMGRLAEGTLPAAPERRSLQLESTKGLRSFLLQQMQAVADGKLDPDRVKAICSLAQQVYMTAKLELEFAKTLQGAPKDIAFNDDQDV